MAYMSGRSASISSNRRAAVIAAAGTTAVIGGFLVARAVHSRQKGRKVLPPPPRARRSDHTDVYWGETVPDPYRWMEKADDEETVAWVEAQVKHTDAYLESELEPSRNNFRSRLEEVFSYDKHSPPWRVGDYWFFYRQEGLSPHAVLYKQVGIDGTPVVLLDPNKLSEDGTSSLRGVDFSKDGKKLAYGVSKKGSDWFSVHVKDIVTGDDLPDAVEWCKFGGICWEEGARGFFYSSFPRPKELETNGKSAGTEVEVATGHRIMYHVVGTESSQDQLVYQSPKDEKWLASTVMSDDWQTLLISIGDSCDPVNRLFYRGLSSFDGRDVTTMGKVVKLVDNFDSLYSYVTNEGTSFWFRTNMDSPKYKVIRMKLPPAGSPMEEDEAFLSQIPKATVIEEDATGVLTSAAVVAGDRMVLCYERDAFVQLELSDLNGARRQDIPVPGIGAIGGVYAEKQYDHFTFKFTNFVTPGTIYYGTVEKPEGKSSEARIKLLVFRETKVPGISTEDFDTKQIRYESKDGTVIPMFVVGCKGAEGPSPCLLYGYGGFNISLNPCFSAARLLFIKHFGARFCLANIRGGGEYGEEWHAAGTLGRKQNVFDDFVYAAKHLSAEGYTTKDQLAILGGSNGGLLVGACVNQHPELFAAAVGQVGVMDMLRFDKFTIGYAWRSDYGSSEASEDQYRTLRAYSPLHNVNPESGPYPAVLLTTGDHDDRVCPLHSFKYMAELQHTIGSRGGEKPLLIRIDRNSGHGGGKPTAKVLAEAADTYAFIAKHTGATWKP